MKIKVKHTTTYQYSELLNRSQQILRLTPMNNSHQHVVQWKLKSIKNLHEYQDWYGNHCSFLEVDKSDKLTELTIEAIGLVETNEDISNKDSGVMPLEYYLVQTDFTELNTELMKFADEFHAKNHSLLAGNKVTEFFNLLSCAILARVPYTKGLTQVDSTAKDAFNLGGGVCQDHTHLMISLARCLNFSARYVSGYIYTSDTTHVESHAWAEVWYNDAWYSFDVSNQCHAGSNHIILAYGNDYSSASPVRGSRVGGGLETLTTFAAVAIQ